MGEKKSKKIVEAVVDTTPRTSVDGVVEHFIQSVGGEAAFGKLLHDEFTASAPGSMTRQRILELIIRQKDRSEQRNHVEDLGEVSTADLERMADAQMVKIMGKVADEDAPKTEEQPK